MYRIRWTNDANNAKPGEEPTNESYYPEDWIFTKENIGLHRECEIVEPHNRSGMPGDGEAMSVGVHHASQASRSSVVVLFWNTTRGSGDDQCSGNCE